MFHVISEKADNKILYVWHFISETADNLYVPFHQWKCWQFICFISSVKMLTICIFHFISENADNLYVKLLTICMFHFISEKADNKIVYVSFHQWKCWQFVCFISSVKMLTFCMWNCWQFVCFISSVKMLTMCMFHFFSENAENLYISFHKWNADNLYVFSHYLQELLEHSQAWQFKRVVTRVWSFNPFPSVVMEVPI
jgi:hypothetical protein